MTIVAAYIDRHGRTAIGCDTQCQGYTKMQLATKLARVGGAVVGSSGSSVWDRFLRESAPRIDNPGDVPAFADALVAWARERGHGDVDGQLWSAPVCALIALPGYLAEVTGDGGIVEPIREEPYLAIGGGEGVARGALYYAHRIGGFDAEEVVAAVVDAAIRHAIGCGGQPVVQVVG